MHSANVPATLVEQVQAALIPKPAGLPPRARQQTSLEAVQRIAELLLAKRGTPAGRDVQHFYAPGVLASNQRQADLRWLLGQTVLRGDRLFLQGAVLGVGASTLVSDFARAFNVAANAQRRPERVAYLKLMRGVNTVPRFLDELAVCVRAPMRTEELRRRGPQYLARRILASLQFHGIASIIIDHVGNAGRDARGLIGDLMQALDPTSYVPLDPADDLLGARVGVVLVDHHAPEVLFRDAPDVLVHLDGNVATLGPYANVAAVGEALRQAGIGLEDFDAGDPDDAELAAIVLSHTQGLPALMNPMMHLMDVLATHHNCRPCPAIACAVQPYLTRLIELREHGTPTGNRRLHLGPRRSTGGKSGAASGRGGRMSRHGHLREKRESRELAEAELRDLHRKSFATI